MKGKPKSNAKKYETRTELLLNLMDWRIDMAKRSDLVSCYLKENKLNENPRTIRT